MKNSTDRENEMTVQTFPISDSEQVEVIERSGYFHASHRRNGQIIGERSAFGAGEQGRKNATNAARQWAFGIRFDRTR